MNSIPFNSYHLATTRLFVFYIF